MTAGFSGGPGASHTELKTDRDLGEVVALQNQDFETIREFRGLDFGRTIGFFRLEGRRSGAIGLGSLGVGCVLRLYIDSQMAGDDEPAIDGCADFIGRDGVVAGYPVAP